MLTQPQIREPPRPTKGIPPQMSTPSANDDPQLVEHIQQRQLLKAVQRYKELTGSNLAEAKASVDALVRSPAYAHLFPSKR